MLVSVLSFRSGAAKEHVEAAGDVPVAVGEGGGAAGRGNRPGLTEFRREPGGAMQSFAGLHQTAAGAQDAAHTSAGYSMPHLCFTSWSSDNKLDLNNRKRFS